MTKKKPTKPPTKEEIEAARREQEKKREAEYWGPHGIRIDGKPVTRINKDSYM